MRAGDICRVEVAHGDVSGIKDAAKLPPHCFVKRQYGEVQHFYRTECPAT